MASCEIPLREPRLLYKAAMGELEKKIQYQLRQKMYDSEPVWKAATEPDREHRTDAVGAIEGFVVPMLSALQEAVLELAREIDQLREEKPED
jgi:hypothetical protein